MKRTLVACIRFYRFWVSPIFPGSCRFYPTCSAYSLEALDRYGSLRGTLMALRRLLKCHPWHPGGFDPVPLPMEKGPEGHRARGDGGRESRPTERVTADRTIPPGNPRPAL